MTAARELIRARRVQALICYAIDRLARNFAHLAILAEEAERYGVTLHFVSEPLDNSPEGRLIQSIKGYVAEIEREKIRERMQRGIRQKLQSGKFLRLGSDIYGYRFDATKNQREIYESEAAVVRDIFDWYLREQIGVSLITKRLNERGVPTPYASKGIAASSQGWYARTVNLMLRREEYAGKTFAGKIKLTITPEHKGHYRYKKSKQVPKYNLADAITPAVIPRERWEQVQTRLDTNSGEGTRNAKRMVLLRGMLYCEKCERKLLQSRMNFKPYYRCENSQPFATGRCRVSIRAEKIENEVWQAVFELFNEPDALARAISSTPTRMRVHRTREIEHLQKELQKLDTAKGRLLRLLQITDDESLASSIPEQLQQQRRQRVSLETALKEFEKSASVEVQPENTSPDPLTLSHQLSSMSRMLEAKSKRKLLELLYLRIILHPDKTWSASIAISADSRKLTTLPEIQVITGSDAAMTATIGRLRIQITANGNTNHQAGELIDFFREAMKGLHSLL